MAQRVNLDDYATPTNAPATQAARREALLAQLGWLIVEAEALGPLLAAVPPALLTGRPTPSARSVKETFGLFATLDRTVRRPHIERILAEDVPLLSHVEDTVAESTDWNAVPLDDLLAQMRAERQALVERLEALPVEDWNRTAVPRDAELADAELGNAGEDQDTSISLATYVLRICQHDADRLRDLAYRLHESKLTRRAEDLPK